MTDFPKRAARSLWVTVREVRATESVLGRDHPLARAASHQHTLASQSLVAALFVLLGIAGMLSHVGGASLVLVAATIVEAAWLVGWACTRRATRDRGVDLVAAGEDGLVLSIVAREQRRLASRKQRESLARSLEHLLRDAQRWYRIAPVSRPLPGVQCLRHLAPEVGDVVALLRSEHARIQGVALTSRLLMDGSRSPLYAGEVDPLREELNRIRFLLYTPNSAADDVGHIRAAA